MANNYNFSENINSIYEKLEKFLKTETVVGEPIQIGDTTLVPFINVSFGLGTGGGIGNDNRGNNGDGSGGGVGARISPTAVLVIKGDKVEMLPVKKLGGLDKLLEMVPGILDKVKEKKEEKEVMKNEEE